MNHPLSKIIDLIKQNGDNCIVLDAQGNPSYVVMGFEKYQKLLETEPVGSKGSVIGLTENELLNKINTDIAAWKASVGQDNLDFTSLVATMDETSAKIDKKDSFSRPVVVEKVLNQAKKIDNTGKTEEKYYFEPID